MYIPDTSYRSIDLRLGQKRSFDKPQFGKWELEADKNGTPDKSFLQLFGAEQKYSVGDLQEVFEGSHDILMDSRLARDEATAVGAQFDSAAAKRNYEKRVAQLLKQCEIVAKTVAVKMHEDCSIRRIDFKLAGAGEGQHAFIYDKSHPEHPETAQLGAGLSTSLRNENVPFRGHHAVRVPFDSEGDLEISELTERVGLSTPWIWPMVADTLEEGAIKEPTDERLEQLAVAAQHSMLLAPESFGPEWKSGTSASGVRSWTLGSQRLFLDPDDQSFSIITTGRRSDTGQQMQFSAKWQDGKFVEADSREMKSPSPRGILSVHTL